MKPQFFTYDSVNKKIFRAAVAVGLATVLVKTGSTVKDLLVARSYGRSDSLDAFLIALVLPTLALNLVAASIAMALTPVLVETKQKKGATDAQQLLSSVMLLTGTFLVATAILLGLCSPWYLHYLAYSFPQQKLLLTRQLQYLLLPWLILNGINTLMAYVLNAIERFSIPALIPIMTPSAVLACVLLWPHPNSGFALVAGTVAGSFLETIFLYYLIRKHQMIGALRWYGLDEKVRAVLSQTMPMMGGFLLMGAAPVVDQVMAASLGSGSVSALNYGNKIPAGLLAISATALGTAVFPYFSKMVAEGNWQGCRHTLKRYSVLIFSVSIPFTALLMIFSRHLVRMLFQRGAFTSADTDVVSYVQIGYSLQIPFYVLSLVFIRFITSMRRNDLLMYGAAISLVVDIAMNLVLMRIWGVAGIAFSTSIVFILAFLFSSICAMKLLNQQSQREFVAVEAPGPLVP